MFLRSALALAAFGLTPLTASAAVLYSGLPGVSPVAEGWALGTQAPAPATIPTPWAAATLSPADPGVTLSTLADRNGYAGFVYTTVPMTPTQNTLRFTAALLGSEVATGGAGSRAGLSVLLLDGSHRGVELGFVPGQVFSQAVGFTAVGESAAFDPTPLTTYTLTLTDTGYALLAGGVPLLAGPLRDYSGTPTVFGPIYSQPHFLFIGDNTTRAAATFQLGPVSVIPESGMALAAIPAGLLLRRRR